jgi:hypothetical protein
VRRQRFEECLDGGWVGSYPNVFSSTCLASLNNHLAFFLSILRIVYFAIEVVYQSFTPRVMAR